MQLQPKAGILAVLKHKRTSLKADITVEETDEDKSLITGEVLSDNSETYKKGDTVVFGKYAIYKLVVQGEEYFLLDEEDVIATCDYQEA